MVMNEASQELKWSSVSLSEVMDSGKRLDATKFDIELKKATKVIDSSPYKIVTIVGDNAVCDCYRPGICKRIFVSKQDNSIEMLTPSQVTDVKPKVEKYLSSLMGKTISNWFVKKGEILLSCSGTIGNITLVSNTLNEKCVSQNMIRIVPKNAEDTGYIYTYLKSKTGQMFLTHNNYGAVIQHIDPEHLQTLKIPLAPVDIRRKINELILSSYRLRDESNELLDKAEQMLIEELSFPPIDEMKNFTGKVNSFNVKLSDLNKRVDASYHIPVVNVIINHLKEHAGELTTIGDPRVSKEIILAGVFKRTYVEEEYGYPFLGGKEISQLNPKTEKFLSKAIHKSRYEKELKVNENMILVSDRGTIGITAMVPKHWNNYAVSQNVLKVIPSNSNIAGYLYVYLNSEYGKILTQRQTYGSVVDMIDNHSLEVVEFPFLKNKAKQQEINDLALQANEKRYLAFCLEQEALKIMDEEVIYVKNN